MWDDTADMPFEQRFIAHRTVPVGPAALELEQTPPTLGGACSSSSGGESGPTGTVLCAMKRCSKGMSAVSSHIFTAGVTNALRGLQSSKQWQHLGAAGIAQLASAAAGLQCRL